MAKAIIHLICSACRHEYGRRTVEDEEAAADYDIISEKSIGDCCVDSLSSYYYDQE